MSVAFSGIRWSNVSKTFDGVRALDDVSLDVLPGTVLAVTGGNGSGKSTLFNVLTGIVRCDSGACYVGEREVSRSTAALIAGLGVARTFQQVRLAGMMTLVENVLAAEETRNSIGMLSTIIATKRVRRQQRERALQYLSEVELAGRGDDLAGQLSFGQQKLLSFASICSMKAGVILLDEPFAGLGQQMIDSVIRRIEEWRRAGSVVALIEHDVRRAREVATRLISMDRGRIASMESL